MSGSRPIPRPKRSSCCLESARQQRPSYSAEGCSSWCQLTLGRCTIPHSGSERPCLYLFRVGHGDLAAIATVGSFRSVARSARQPATDLLWVLAQVSRKSTGFSAPSRVNRRPSSVKACDFDPAGVLIDGDIERK